MGLNLDQAQTSLELDPTPPEVVYKNLNKTQNMMLFGFHNHQNQKCRDKAAQFKSDRLLRGFSMFGVALQQDRILKYQPLKSEFVTASGPGRTRAESAS